MLLTVIGVIAAVFAASQIFLRLVRTVELHELAVDCWNLFGETADADVDLRRFKDMDQRLFALQSRTNWPMRGYLIDLDHAVENVYATSPLHDDRPESVSATAFGTPWEPRSQERQDQIAAERWAWSMKGQDVAQELMTLARRFDRLTVGR